MVEESANDIFGMTMEIATFWVDFWSTIFFLITTGFLIWSFVFQWKEHKLSKESLHIDKYGALRDHHHDIARLLVEEEDLQVVFQPTSIELDKREKDNSGKIMLTKEELRIFNFYILELDLYERIFELREEQKELDEPEREFKESEWVGWLLYLEKMSYHWIFTHTYNEVKDMYDDDFMEEVRTKIIEKPDARELLKEYEIAYNSDYRGLKLNMQKEVSLNEF